MPTLARAALLAFPLLALGCGAAAPPQAAPKTAESAKSAAVQAPETGLAAILSGAKRLAPLVKNPFAKRFLASTEALPRIAPRVLWHDAEKTRFLRADAYEGLPPAEKNGFSSKPIDEEFYYNTKYGSPLAYARPLDLLAEAGASLSPGSRFFDFGYGGAGHLRMLASLGLNAHGVDVDPMLVALYGFPGDQGAVDGFKGPAGSLALASGRWPGEIEARRSIGGPFEVIISKNVLKKGYIHPDRPADERRLIKLGVDDATFLKAIFDSLAPGGFFLIYNICPKPTPPDKPFIPWSDGRSPFSREAFQAAGLSVEVFDRDDTETIRQIGHALEWDKGEDAMDLENDLSVLYTLVSRPKEIRAASGVL